MRYEIDENVFVNTDNAKKSWPEETYWNGSNHISKATGSQWVHETLFLSAKGRYYIVATSQWQGTPDAAHLITAEQAAAWLLRNDHELPANLAEYEVSE